MDLKNYDFIETDDGSITVFSKLYNEACHSTAGAASETKVHYIDGCRVVEKSKNSNIKIFEVGFGVGIGFFETYKAALSPFTFVTIEIDEDLVLYTLNNNPLLSNFIKKDYYYHISAACFDLYILIGNGRDSFPKFQKEFSFKYNCIYQDAFSPKRNAILWTTEWFKDLFNSADTDCIMSTYSASSSIRKSMIAGGWTVYDGLKFGRKRSSTRAKIGGVTEQYILEHLERSPVITITDENYLTYNLD
jgi:tRNA U34 5-methylaminomethyl-2-thiouridine-forming methyltransferase MnmC